MTAGRLLLLLPTEDIIKKGSNRPEINPTGLEEARAAIYNVKLLGSLVVRPLLMRTAQGLGWRPTGNIEAMPDTRSANPIPAAFLQPGAFTVF